jgi:hypothetical protein
MSVQSEVTRAAFIGRLLRCCSWLSGLADKDIGIGARQRD